MEMDALWNAVLTGLVALIAWWIKSQADEVRRVQILLNKTREDMAKEYVTRADSTATLAQIVQRFDRIEEKIDRLVERKG
jgi:CHASE3 domain sensor protein